LRTGPSRAPPRESLLSSFKSAYERYAHKEEQKALNHRLNNVEHLTTTTDENIRAMMAHWKITPATIKRKYIENFEVDENESAAGNANLPTTSEQGQGAKCF